MLIFIDESGDPGLKLEQGSSKYFTIGMVVFEDNDEAVSCDQRIQLLKKEIGWNEADEFHFKRNSHKVRKAFLTAVAPYNFFYYGIVINKDPKKLYGEGFQNKASFYKYACGLVFQNAKDRLQNAIVILDKTGSLNFQNQLKKYLRTKMNTKTKLIKEVKQQRSESNNLLQLADYVASVVNRSVTTDKSGSDELRRIIAHREIQVQVWPNL